jgi:hypothetical protein
MSTVPQSINQAGLTAVPEFGVAFWRGAFRALTDASGAGERQIDYLRFALIAILCKPKYSKFSHGYFPRREIEMARVGNNLDSMSFAELAQMQARIGRLKIEKQNSERNELRQRIIAMVKEHGLRSPTSSARAATAKAA